MSSKTLFCLTFVVSIFAVEGSFECYLRYGIDMYHGKNDCPNGYCFMEIQVGSWGGIKPLAQGCANSDVIEESKNLLNRWVKRDRYDGTYYELVCDYVKPTGTFCNLLNAAVVDLIQAVENGSSVCYSSEDVGMVRCNSPVKCEYSKSLYDGEVFMGCARNLTAPIGFCYNENNDHDVRYFCDSTLCNHIDVCKPPATTTSPAPIQKFTIGITELTSSATKKRRRRKRRKNNGTRFSVPNVVKLMVVVGVYFTV